jgi:DNA-binding phage protein
VPARKDIAFREAMLKEDVDAMLAGDVETGKSILRDYINAAVGFGRLSEVTHIPAKSLMRMFSPKGNPRAYNLFQIIKDCN